MRSSDRVSRLGLGLELATNPADEILVRGLAFFGVLSVLLAAMAVVAR